MNQTINLVKRNIKIFLRDKTAVFFSFLSVIILLALYVLFIGNNFKSTIPDVISKNDTEFLTIGQMMGGVLVVNTITLSLGMMGNMVNDLHYKKLESFLVTPVSRYKIFLSYFLSTVLVTYILSVFMFLLTVLYLLITTMSIYSILVILKVILLLFLYTLISTSIMLFIISFIKSINAFGTISGVFGTFIGFVSGIYMPLEILPNFVKHLSSLIPFTHMTTVLKQVMLNDSINNIKNQVTGESLLEIKKYFGLNKVEVFGFDVNMILIFLGIIIISAGLFVVTIRRLSKKD